MAVVLKAEVSGRSSSSRSTLEKDVNRGRHDHDLGKLVLMLESSTKKGRGILGCAANSFDLNSNFLKESIREALAK